MELASDQIPMIAGGLLAAMIACYFYDKYVVAGVHRNGKPIDHVLATIGGCSIIILALAPAMGLSVTAVYFLAFFSGGLPVVIKTWLVRPRQVEREHNRKKRAEEIRKEAQGWTKAE